MNSDRNSSSGAQPDDGSLKSRRRFLLKGALGAAMIPLATRMAGCGNSSNTNPDMTNPQPDMSQTSAYSSTDLQILATGFQVEKQAAATYTTAVGLGKLMDPFLTIANQFKADHEANAAVFMTLYNAAKTATDPALADPTGDLTTVFPPKSTYPLTSDTNILIYALGLELLAAQVYASLATTTGSQGMTKFSTALKVSATLSISRTNLAGIAAATDVSANALQHAMALRAALVLFKAQTASMFLLSSAGTKTGTPADFDPTMPNNFPKFFGSAATVHNPNDYLA